MKHGQEKSDLFIIALKPTNKPGRLGAELVEPRERTEGNMGEESISNRGLCGLLLNFRLLFVLHCRIPANEGLPELVIEHLRSDLQ